MAVKLRAKELKNGIQSYYLEYYHGYSKTENGNKNKRTYKFLNLYSKPNDAKHNKKVFKEAQNILTIENGKFLENKISYVASIDGKKQIIEVFKKYIIHKTTKKSENVFLSSLNYLKSFIEINENRNKVKDIDLNLCEDYYKYLVNFIDSNTLKVATVNSYFKKFSQFVYWLYENKKLTDNPAKSIKLKKVPSTKKCYLTDNELLKLLAFPNKTVIQKAFLFGCFTGLRFVDIQNLKYSDIYYNSEKNNYHLYIEQSKTGESLDIFLTEEAMSLINTDKEFMGKNILVFSGLTYSDYNNKKLREWSKINGINKHFAFHTGRYTMIVRLVNIKAEPYQIQRVLGHTSFITTSGYIKNLDVRHNLALQQLPKLTA